MKYLNKIIEGLTKESGEFMFMFLLFLGTIFVVKIIEFFL